MAEAHVGAVLGAVVLHERDDAPLLREGLLRAAAVGAGVIIVVAQVPVEVAPARA